MRRLRARPGTRAYDVQTRVLRAYRSRDTYRPGIGSAVALGLTLLGLGAGALVYLLVQVFGS